jgi:hypothetical protein
MGDQMEHTDESRSTGPYGLQHKKTCYHPLQLSYQPKSVTDLLPFIVPRHYYQGNHLEPNRQRDELSFQTCRKNDIQVTRAEVELPNQNTVMSCSTVQRVTELEQTAEFKDAIDEAMRISSVKFPRKTTSGFKGSKPNPKDWSECYYMELDADSSGLNRTGNAPPYVPGS